MYLILILFSYNSLFYPFTYGSKELKKGERLIATHPLLPLYSLISWAVEGDFFILNDFSFSFGLTNSIEIYYYNINCFTKENKRFFDHLYHYFGIKTTFSNNKFSIYLSPSFRRVYFISSLELLSLSMGVKKSSTTSTFNIGTNLFFLVEEKIKIPKDIIMPLYISYYSEDEFAMEGYIVFNDETLFLLGVSKEKKIKNFLITAGVIFPFYFPKKTSYFSIPPVPVPIIKISYLF